MSPTPIRGNAARLIQTFDAEALGGGDPDAGGNVLAAMALVISDVQRPQSSVVIKSNDLPIELGCSLLVSGGLSPKLVEDLLLVPLRRLQNHVFANIRAGRLYDKRRWDRCVRTGREVDYDPSEWEEPPFARLDSPVCNDEQEHQHRSMQMLESPPKGGFYEISHHPVVHACAGSPGEAGKILPVAHLGRPLVHIPLKEPDDCAAFAKMADRLTQGCQVLEPHPRGVRGEVVVTDPRGAIRRALQCGLEGTDWLGCGLWLVDHAGGPSLATPPESARGAKLECVIGRYRNALRNALAGRLSAGTDQPVCLVLDIPPAMQQAWLGFLRNHEAAFPGISGTLWALPASLLYGLIKMRNVVIDRRNPGPNVHIDDVYEFATQLVQRMVNARALMLQDGRRARIERLAATVARKLADGPLTVRELLRKSHRLQAADCEEALEILMLRGQVQRTGSAWSLRQPVVQPEPLTLNV